LEGINLGGFLKKIRLEEEEEDYTSFFKITCGESSNLLNFCLLFEIINGFCQIGISLQGFMF